MEATGCRRAICLAAVVAMVVSALPIEAATIDFDSVITQPAGAVPPVDVGPGLALDYETPWVPPGPPDAFYTQGFAFGGRTAGVTATSPTRPGFGVVLDPSVCELFGTACAHNGTRFLAFDIAARFLREDFGPFSIDSFSASQAFEDDSACPGCNDGIGIQNAAYVRVSGFDLGALVAQETFALSYGFQTFILLDPDWALVDRVVFQPLDAAGIPGIADVNPCCTLGPDDIEAHPVPEPSKVLSLGAGIACLAGLTTRRRPARCGPGDRERGRVPCAGERECAGRPRPDASGAALRLAAHSADCVRLNHAPRLATASASGHRISYINVAPTSAVLPLGSKGGATSTTSPPMTSSPRSRVSASSVVSPPTSGVPVPGV